MSTEIDKLHERATTIITSMREVMAAFSLVIDNFSMSAETEAGNHYAEEAASQLHDCVATIDADMRVVLDGLADLKQRTEEGEV